MTIGQSLYAVLAAVGGVQDVSPNIAPDRVARPNVVFQEIVTPKNNSFAGRSNYQKTMFQIDCYAVDYAGAKVLAQAVEDAMDAANTAAFSCRELSTQDLYESDVKLHRVMLYYSVWHT